ncbi:MULTISPECIES: 50S ribosomal protein L24 [Nosocomiicoccus]|uniref:Large ribosomal subunit protein uL24 n=1 Tax=Nosocomiicoccus massiliensis TaxID=1232430 RepID=A0AAF0YNK4_9STAP|nr:MULTISPECIES: 50S ribosomal protein L24 [Nosocomiicoccus]MDK6862937.1 50S ribosomal protein L24 [Nosocomiicoccus ampullae]OFL47181.1 50S ribosomal protein L24 [Nosocomiicoccus sp. HMSC067E10]OFO54161.1 50S ribosomal protein L24 [Nosocomiicoccus sp. HMSC059G07]OFS63212.1 50S ribosomal protein L24 [Nosocomiicoccus sp. HMSC09A07]WOS95776.1 50S ribosomal protein L24 [Nosocomiicoccus massiliensis]
MHVKTGDKVIVISGKDKGKQGTVLKAIPREERVVVEGVNMVKKHQKPSQLNPDGGILETEAAIHVSNVMHVDPDSGERTRIRYEEKDGKKIRVAVKSGKEIK